MRRNFSWISQTNTLSNRLSALKKVRTNIEGSAKHEVEMWEVRAADEKCLHLKSDFSWILFFALLKDSLRPPSSPFTSYSDSLGFLNVEHMNTVSWMSCRRSLHQNINVAVMVDAGEERPRRSGRTTRGFCVSMKIWYNVMYTCSVLVSIPTISPPTTPQFSNRHRHLWKFYAASLNSSQKIGSSVIWM